jgi:RimJ/RimL family protein N-acetyltransferase
MKPLVPRVLEGIRVRLEPLTMEHVPALRKVAFDPELWQITVTNLRHEEDLRRYVEEALAEHLAGRALAFCTIDMLTDTAVGSTRFGNYDPANRRVEIGWTWVARPWQGTTINAEAKLLMLEYAFEELQCLRVEFKTDHLNRQSQRALEKIGAVREGILRSHMVVQDGRRRDSVYFSVLAEEWPSVREALRRRIGAAAGES